MLNTVEVKRMLLDYLDLEREIDNQIERLESLESRIYSVGSPEMSDMPKNPSPSNDRMSLMIERKMELEEKIKKLIDEQTEKRKKFEDAIEKISFPDQRAVIRMRYLDGEKWESIVEMLFGENEEFDEKRDSYMRRVMILHGQALQQLADVINERF